jgi:hypothetical protein
MIAGVPAIKHAAHAAVLRGALQRMDRRRGAGDGLEIGAANAAPTRRRGGAAIRASGCGHFSSGSYQTAGGRSKKPPADFFCAILPACAAEKSVRKNPPGGKTSNPASLFVDF